jgi:MFS family permease
MTSHGNGHGSGEPSTDQTTGDRAADRTAREGGAGSDSSPGETRGGTAAGGAFSETAAGGSLGSSTQERIRDAMLALFGRALRHRNFRLFTAGQSLSLVGTWMQQVAVSWLVYRMTGSAFLLGLVGFVSQFPNFVLAPLAGVLADRIDKRRIVLVTQTVMMVAASILAAMVLTDRVTVVWVLVLMGVQGAAQGFDIPARQSFLVEMVGDREDLPNAIALNSSMFNAARLVGPAIAGLVIAAVGEGICMLLNAISFLAVLAALLAMRLERRKPVHVTPMLAGLTEGFRYAYGIRPMRSILFLVASISLVGVPFTVLLPVIATGVLGGDARTLGFLMAASGLGALAGALYLASRRSVRGLGRIIVIAATLFGAALIFTGLSRFLWLSLASLAVAGFGMMVQMASSNTVLQTIVDDDKRGRVMSLYSMAFTGVSPLGSLLVGGIASGLGAPFAIALSGVSCLVVSAVFARRLPVLRAAVVPIYTRLGILPEVARGVQAATHNVTTRDAF